MPSDNRNEQPLPRIDASVKRLIESLSISSVVEREVAIVRELEEMAQGLPFLTTVLFRASFTFIFESGLGVDRLSDFIARVCERVPVHYRSLVRPLQAEILIRADFYGESNILQGFSYDRDELYDTLLLVTRIILLSLSDDPHIRTSLKEMVLRAASETGSNASGSATIIASVFSNRNVGPEELGDAGRQIALALKG